MTIGIAIIINEIGLHARPASVFCNTALQFQCDITFKLKDKSVNAKSIMAVMAAKVKYGDEIEIICDGADEKEAMTALLNVVRDGLGE